MINPTACYPDLEGRLVFVSGGASGIGAALVEAFARQKATVAFVDLYKDAGVELTKRLKGEGFSAHFYHCDITDISSYQNAIETVIRDLGPIRVLLNNAANDERHILEDLTSQKFDEYMNVNLKHAMFAAQSVVPGMKKAGGGSIINFGSVGWMMASAGYPVYAACKAAAHGMTRGLAREFGPYKIRVNTLVPGWVMTEKQKRLWVDDAAREEIAKSQCLSGELLPEHIANMALFLGSDASSMCTAQNFIVDGGWV
jgi:D-xylose 1-dehydrogenase